jgi:hypothetical protein
LILKQFRQLAGVFIAQRAIEFVVCQPVHFEFVGGFGALPVTLHALYLRPTVGQFAHKFFENTRDSGNGEFVMVSTRLPKNF